MSGNAVEIPFDFVPPTSYGPSDWTEFKVMIDGKAPAAATVYDEERNVVARFGGFKVVFGLMRIQGMTAGAYSVRMEMNSPQNDVSWSLTARESQFMVQTMTPNGARIIAPSARAQSSEPTKAPTAKGVLLSFIGRICSSDSSLSINECFIRLIAGQQTKRLSVDGGCTAFSALIDDQPADSMVMINDDDGSVVARDGIL